MGTQLLVAVVSPSHHSTDSHKMDHRISLILLLVVALSFGDALKCHQCNSHDNEKCGDPFVDDEGNVLTDEFLLPCADANATLCRKIYQYIRGEESIIRTCGKEEQKYDCYTTVLEEYNSEVCACDNEDGCNGSSALSVSFVSIILTALGAYLVGK